MAYTKQVKAANPLNNGFTNSYQTGDGVNLFTASGDGVTGGDGHPRVDGGKNDNRPATAADLNETSLENAVIDISTYCHDEFAYISVKDNGPGISAELTDKIFEPFYTSRSQGTGLGLAVVKSVTNAHQGEVSLISKPGEGAHFCIKIPLLIGDNSSPIMSENDQATFMSKELSNDHK